MAGTLRLATGLLVIATAIAAGFWLRSPWIVLLLALSFTVLYVGGKLDQWRHVWMAHGPSAVAKTLVVTLPIQGVLAGLFYLIGAGVGALAGRSGFAARLDDFDFALAGGLLAVGLVATAAIHAAEAREQRVTPETMADVLSPEIRAVMDEAFELSQQVVAMPVQIFSLARRLADHPDKAETLAAMGEFFDDENAFVRRVAYTALRFMGQGGRDLDPTTLDRRIVSGMSDPAVWVRYDAAWAAGDIAGDDQAFAAALRAMILDAEASGADALEENDSARKALERARTSLTAVETRGG